MLRAFNMDLHVHTCLSPCADLSMVPSTIVGRGMAAGLDVVAVCDHNSAENVRAVRAAGKRQGLTVLGGMEITTREEIHVLAYFDREENLAAMQELVYDHLPGTNDVSAFGEQVVVDECDRPLELNEHLLIGATDLSIEETIAAIHRLSGLAVASHVDRGAFSIVSQLGFIPETLALDGLELSVHHRPGTVVVGQRPVFYSSDAHFPEEIGRAYTRVKLEKATVEELKKAIGRVEGRGFV